MNALLLRDKATHFDSPLDLIVWTAVIRLQTCPLYQLSKSSGQGQYCSVRVAPSKSQLLLDTGNLKILSLKSAAAGNGVPSACPEVQRDHLLKSQSKTGESRMGPVTPSYPSPPSATASRSGGC